MRYLLTCLLLVGWWTQGWGQVARVEYFVDADPGLGLATPVSITPGTDITANFTVPLSTSSPGFHALYVRTRDAQRRWSLTYQHPFFTTVLAPANQVLTRAEYFLDTDPGIGLGQAVALPANASATVPFNVSLAAVSPGFHALYVRVRDTQGVWSLTQQHAFYTVRLAASSQVLTRAEYFVDTDPGIGSGTAITTLPANRTNATISLAVGLTGLSAGFHALYLRTRDAQGAWSHTQQHAFYAINLPASQALVRAEYFIDQEPGLGNGTAITLPASQQNVTLPFTVPLGGVAVGAHTLFLRVADRTKAWSATSQHAFLVRPGGGLANITAFEYYFTGLGTNAAYVSSTRRYVVPTPAASVSLNFAADLSGVPGDTDYNMSIVAVSSEGLKSLVLTKRIRACNGLPVAAGFDFAQEGREVYFVNSSTNATRYRWSFGDGSTDTTANPLHTYAAIGNYTVRLISSSFCNPDTVTQTVSIRGLRDITTNHGGNTGAVSVVVTGAGFVPGMQLLLRRAGQADIVGDTVITRSSSVITTGFNLTGKVVGQWDVVAIYPGGVTAILTNGFNIENGVDNGLWVNIAGPSILRLGFRQVYTVTYGNNGNTDAVVVPLFIRGLPRGTNIELLDSTFRFNRLPGFDTLTVYPIDSLKYSILDSLSNEMYRMLIIRRISAGSTGTLNFVFTLPNSTLLGTRPVISTSLDNPLLTSVEGLRRGASLTSSAECIGAVISTAGSVLANIVNIGAWRSCRYSAYGAAMSLNNYIAKNPDKRTVADGFALTWAITSTIANCASAAIGTTPQGRILRILLQGARLFGELEKSRAGNAITGGLLFNDCKDIFVREAESQSIPSVGGASDPNAKYGPGGGSHHHYINKDAPLAYSIGFENLPAANLNAQTVRVTDTLSAQAFNRASFAFTSVTLGTLTYALPAPTKSFVHDFDFVAQYGVKARVIGTFDAATGIASWTFFSIDPATNQVTTNALAGFLPPNMVSPRGQGYVSFTVQANAARQTGDVIGNRASIVFDFNPPIITNNWHNTFDLVRPSSAVTAAVPTAVANELRVSWTGTDVGSAIQSYDIVYTVNGRNPRNWLVGTSATTALFTGQRDSTYCFYSIARDSAGNVEAAPLVPDACRSLVLSSRSTFAAVESFLLYPNPSTGQFTVETHSRRWEQSSIRVEDVTGRSVYTNEVRLDGSIQRWEIDIHQLPVGVYFVKVVFDGKTMVRKLLKL